ncbi:MAG TPA: 50S ribosomal protein L29 [Alphaproteobacteria bacterium]|nr:50S ribosomal protein L29 [Alphaproteobacteria bacterium]
MKFKDIQKMPKDELSKKLVDLKTELMKLNAQIAVGTTVKNTKQVRDIKRTIAKIETLNNQSGQKQVAAAKAKKYKNL